MAVCYEGQGAEEWVIIVRYGRRLDRSWEYSFYLECDFKLLVKATGVILLLSVGSFVCYKICNHYWPRTRPRPPRPRPRPHNALVPGQFQDTEEQLLEDLEDGELSEIEGRYFGPNQLPREGDIPTINESFPCSRSASGSLYPNSSTSQSDSGTSGEEEARDADVSDGSQGEKSPKPSLLFTTRQQKHLSWPQESPVHSRHRFRPKSYDASLKGLSRQRESSGWLVDKISKILSSDPEPSQLSERNVWAKLPSSPSMSARLSRAEARRSSELGLEWSGSRRLAPEGAEMEPCQGSTDGDNLGASTSIARDESYDSLGFSKRLDRDGSFDSTCSDMSFDFSLPESSMGVDAQTGTMLCLEKLQQEIDQLKTNCLMMDEEFETIKCNRNLPGMSSLMKAKVSNNSLAFNNSDANPAVGSNSEESMKHLKARECFAGLYSLTHIKNSTSSELSDSYPNPVPGLGAQGSIGSAESLDWDSPKVATSPAKFVLGGLPEDVDDTQAEDVLSATENKLLRLASEDISTTLIIPTPSEDELLANLEWDEEDLTVYPETGVGIEEETNILSAVDTLEMDLETELGPVNQSALEGPESITSSRSFTASPITDSYCRSSKMESSSGFESSSKMADSCTSVTADAGARKNWTCWSSEESGCMEWDTTVTATNAVGECWDVTQSSSNPSEMSTPVSENPLSPLSEVASSVLENIGQRMNILQYAAQEWHGKTSKAERILQGYSKIPSLMGLHHIRRIRGDNYCGIRAAIFQTLAQGHSVPSGTKTFECLSHALNSEGCGWLQEWTFAGRLPYQGNNVLHGMEVCLRNLDNVASLLLTTNGDREETLAALLNSDPTLDLHLVEAVKLHMLRCAMQLHQENASGSDNVPLFAILMFARDSSETPRDLMNNHLVEVGNTGGLEQVEMFLLGYSLGVTLRVVRPAVYGTEDFVCSYPDWNEGNWPQVVLVAEDDRHYNVLVN